MKKFFTVLMILLTASSGMCNPLVFLSGSGTAPAGGGGWVSGNALVIEVGPDTDNPDWRAITPFTSDQTDYEPQLEITYSGPTTWGYTDANDDSQYTTVCDLTSQNMKIGHDGTNDSYGYFRFTNVTIPQGATITSAYIRLYRDSWTGGDTNLLIRGVDADNAAVLATDDCGNSRPKTTASVDWDLGVADDPGWGQDFTSPSIGSIIQEIVNR